MQNKDLGETMNNLMLKSESDNLQFLITEDSERLLVGEYENDCYGFTFQTNSTTYNIEKFENKLFLILSKEALKGVLFVELNSEQAESVIGFLKIAKIKKNIKLKYEDVQSNSKVNIKYSNLNPEKKTKEATIGITIGGTFYFDAESSFKIQYLIPKINKHQFLLSDRGKETSVRIYELNNSMSSVQEYLKSELFCFEQGNIANIVNLLLIEQCYFKLDVDLIDDTLMSGQLFELTTKKLKTRTDSR